MDFKPRDRLAKHIPGWLVDELKSGFAALAAQCFRPPSNEYEAQSHQELVEQGYAVVRRGWPDFMVLDGDDIFLVEVKGPNDSLSCAQRIVLETLARKGIDVYVRWCDKDGLWGYETIGQSKPFWDHRQKHWKNASQAA